jgi:hypothetical protein
MTAALIFAPLAASAARPIIAAHPHEPVLHDRTPQPHDRAPQMHK